MNGAHPALGTYAAYRSSAEELAEQLLRLNLLLAQATARFRERHVAGPRRGLGGIAVFDDEVDVFLGAPPPDPPVCDGEEMRSARLRNEERACASIAEGNDFPLERIRRCFGLGALEFDAFLLCVAAELDPGYRRVFAYLNNDLMQQRPSIALLVDVLSERWSDRLETRRALGRASPLFRFALLNARPSPDELTAEISVDPSLIDFIAGNSLREDGAFDELTLSELLLSPSEREHLEHLASFLVQSAAKSPRQTVVVLSGGPGAGKRTTARALCRELGGRLRLVQVRGIDELELARCARDARLAGDTLGVALQLNDQETEELQNVIEVITRLPLQLVLLVVESDETPRLGRPGGARVVGMHVGTPPAPIRRTAWNRALREAGLRADGDGVQTVAAVYPFSVGRIYAAVRDLATQVETHDVPPATVGIRELAAAARNQTSHHLERLAQPLPLRHGWCDIVLPDDERARLKEIADAVRNRDRVMEQWGFSEKIAAGPGVNAVFFGPSGTGKTMAASILAAELGMAIYRVDLSRVVSKYIGETERNLDALFDEARRSFGLLFFDEAEAIFGKRSEVKDAHDRYANIEIAYLLQRMETFEGVAILATNLRKHMDNAFLRRLQFAVEFPLPQTAQRLQIWRQVWPAPAELADDLDLESIARRFEFSGGHIRNVAMMSAYLACEEGTPIGMRHLLAATKREFQKLGRGARVDD
jgi:hypothetical protein